MHNRLETLLAGPLAMVASLHAATEVWRARTDRLRGHDASESEPQDQVSAHLHDAADLLAELAFRANAARVAIEENPKDEAATRVLELDALLGVNRAATTMEEAHRRLMSLYPDVDEEFVEAARQLATQLREVLEAGQHLPSDDVEVFVAALREQVLSE
jgi:hypothetical protein